jgi:hypothetical protein
MMTPTPEKAWFRSRRRPRPRNQQIENDDEDEDDYENEQFLAIGEPCPQLGFEIEKAMMARRVLPCYISRLTCETG